MIETRKQADNRLWSRCDVCGHFVGWNAFLKNQATRRLVMPDSDRSSEEWETLCPRHKDD